MFDLKLFRKNKKISQTNLADMLGVGQSFISQIESGKDPMPEAFIAKLSEIYPTDNIRDYIREEDAVSDNNEDDIISIGTEAYAKFLNKLIKERLFAPFAFLEQKDQEIKELNREIGRLEERLEANKKTDVQEDDTVTCADAR